MEGFSQRATAAAVGGDLLVAPLVVRDRRYVRVVGGSCMPGTSIYIASMDCSSE